MIKYEYKVIEIDHSKQREIDVLQKLGLSRWECFQIIVKENHLYIYYFKRVIRDL